MIQPERILVLRRRALGDLVVSLPLLRALREQWPQARLTLLVDSALREVAERSEADAVMLYARREFSSGAPWRRLRALSRWRRNLRASRFDVVLDLHGTPQTALWTHWTAAPLRVGRERRWRSWAYNRLLPQPASDAAPRFAGEVFLDWVRALGIDPGPWEPAGFASIRRRDAGVERPRVVLNPSATWSAKAWPNEHWARLARLLRDSLGERPWLAWGPDEAELRDEILALAGDALRPLPPTGILALAQQLADADLLITGDSGPKHLAVAVDTPTLTLFGSTDPRGWQPPGARHRAMFDQSVSCRPCDLLECPIAGHPCMSQLQPESILAAARKLLHAADAEGESA